MKGIKYPCRIYAFQMDLSGQDDFQLQGVAKNDQELFERLRKVRDDFHDTYKELDRYVYLTDESENQLRVKPSSILRRLGGDVEKDKASQIARKCMYCYYMVDGQSNYCNTFGLVGCEKYVSVERYWKTPEGKKRIQESEENERKFWETQPPERREYHELNEEFFQLYVRWLDTPKSKRKSLDDQMDKIAARLKELCETLGETFVEWRNH